MFPTPVHVCSACHPGPMSGDLAGSAWKRRGPGNHRTKLHSPKERPEMKLLKLNFQACCCWFLGGWGRYACYQVRQLAVLLAGGADGFSV